MKEYLPLIYLILAFFLAAIITRWFNWLAWGERRDRKMDRMKKHRDKLDGKSDDGPGAG